jgi:hypothetical protein
MTPDVPPSYAFYPNQLPKCQEVAMAALTVFPPCVEAHVLLGLCSSSFEIAEGHFQAGVLHIPSCFNMGEMEEVLEGGEAWGCPPARAIYRLRLALANVQRKQVGSTTAGTFREHSGNVQ